MLDSNLPVIRLPLPARTVQYRTALVLGVIGYYAAV